MSNYISLINFDAPGGRCDTTPIFANVLAFSELIRDLLVPFRESKVDALASGTRVLLTDDWIETGAQMAAAVQLVEDQGGIVVGICVLNIDANEGTRQLQTRYRCHSILKDCVA